MKNLKTLAKVRQSSISKFSSFPRILNRSQLHFVYHFVSGSFGRVSKIRKKVDGKILVWKELDYRQMGEKEKQQIVAEVNILRELRHPNIVCYFDRHIDRPNNKIFIIMEYC